MFWTLSLQLLPDESVVEESADRKAFGTDPLYSVFLTNKRIIFRFNSLGSSLTQSFLFDEIIDAEPCKRLLINYLKIKTSRRSFLLNISEPDYWAKTIKGMRDNIQESIESSTTPPEHEPLRKAKKSELLEMLTILKNNSLLNDNELEEKVRMLESKKLA
jgi:hypothetical protein